MAGEYFVEGYDEDDVADVMGAFMQNLRNRRQQGGGGQQRGGGGFRGGGGNRGRLLQAPQIMPAARPPLPASPTQAIPAEMKSFLGLGVLSWGPAEAGDKQLEVEPQESFRGQRLIIDIAVAGGTAAGLTIVRSLFVGSMPQSPSIVAPMPATAFRADATDVELDLQIAFRGSKMVLQMGQTAAPGAGVTVTAAAGLFGVWIR